MNVAINGFGRIGKNFLRSWLQDPAAQKKFTITHINSGPGDTRYLAHLFKYDTLMGTYPGTVTHSDGLLVIDDHKFIVMATKTPSWHGSDIEWVVDCSGHYTHREAAQTHIEAGAHRVLISAPATGDDVTIIPGVNNSAYKPETDKIVSLGSCTTNALVPVLDVLVKQCGLQTALISTVHAYTASQFLLDGNDTDPRRARAGALNIIPTSTGALGVVAKVIPSLEGKISGGAVRVPVGKVSFLEVSYLADRGVSVDDIIGACRAARAGYLKGIMEVTDEPLVSADFFGNPASVIVDAPLVSAVGRLGRVSGWYDNEWGYSERLKDFLCFV